MKRIMLFVAVALLARDAFSMKFVDPLQRAEILDEGPVKLGDTFCRPPILRREYTFSVPVMPLLARVSAEIRHQGSSAPLEFLINGVPGGALSPVFPPPSSSDYELFIFDGPGGDWVAGAADYRGWLPVAAFIPLDLLKPGRNTLTLSVGMAGGGAADDIELRNLSVALRYLNRDDKITDLRKKTKNLPLPYASEDDFRIAAYLARGRYGMPAAAAGEAIYVLGGMGPEGLLGSVEKYDVTTDAAEVLPLKLIPRRYHTAEAWEGKIYVIGGESAGGDLVPEVEAFDPADNSVAVVSRLPTPRRFPASVVKDGKIYVIGGAGGGNRCLGAVEIYDIASNTWSTAAPMPTARECDIVLYGDNIYAIAGFDGEKALPVLEKYDLGQDAWEKLPDLPFPLSAHRAVLAGKKIFTFGDYADLGRVCVYDIPAGNWQALETSYAPSRHNAAIAHGGNAYVIGGNVASGGSWLDFIQRADLATLAQSPARPPPLAERSYPGLIALQGKRLGKEKRPPQEEDREGGPDQAALDKIALPETPTREQIRQYINEILAAGRGQRRFSSRDPQVGMLKKVGPDNLDLLVEAYSGKTGSFYLTWAIGDLAGENDKELILKSLPDKPDLLSVVQRRGWTDEARPILIAKVKEEPATAPLQWITTVASFQLPETYDALKQRLLSGPSRFTVFEAIRNLPGIELSDTVAKAWQSAKNGFEHETAEMLPAAIEYGDRDALDKAFSLLEGDDYPSRRAREAILLYTDADGSDEDLKAWFERNRERIAYDPKRKMFLAGEKQETDPAAFPARVKADDLKKGDRVPDFTARDIEGKTITLSELKGKVVLVDFWATWCGPCVKEMPKVLEAYRRYHDRGFEVIGISLDRDEEKLKNYVKQKGIAWPQIFSKAKALSDKYGVKGIPEPILLDRELKVYVPNARADRLETGLRQLLP